MRRRARIDDTQAEIVATLRAHGVLVKSLAQMGQGWPDLLVAYGRRCWLVECKDGGKAPSDRQLTHDQVAWFAEWDRQGPPVVVLYGSEDAASWARGKVSLAFKAGARLG